jgi:diamine N-acetyltransferase
MIYGKRIRLRAVERADLPNFVRWLNDPEVRAGLTVIYPLSMAEEEQWFEKTSQAPVHERPLVIEVKDGETWLPVGDCGYNAINWRNRSAELGICIGEKSYWNQGLGTECMGLLLGFGFQELNLERIFLRVYDNNPGAIRAYEKAGFVHEGRLRRAEFRQGEYHDVLVMSVLREEWLK